MQWHLLGWINRGIIEKARQDLETNIRSSDKSEWTMEAKLTWDTGEPRGERDVIRLRNPTEDKRAFRRMLTSANPSILVPRARRFLVTWSGNEGLWKQPLPDVRKFLTSGCACAEVTNITAHAHNNFCPSPLHWGKLVGYKLSQVALDLGTRMRSIRPGETAAGRIRLFQLCS